MKNKANTFIMGAAKCGTTALSEYLRCHPDVLMSTPKESFYFADDFPGMRKNVGFDCSLEKYEKMFFTKEKNKKIFCDASGMYFCSKISIDNIKVYNKDAKLVVMLRKPSDMIYSFHSQLLYNLDEDIKGFKKAWNMSEQRKNGLSIPKTCHDMKLLDYKRMALFGEQLEYLYSVFDKENVHVILFDDFIAEPVKSYAEVLKFLAIKDIEKKSFPKINENKIRRFIILHKIISKLPKNLINLIKFIKLKANINKSLLSFTIKKQSRVPLDNNFKKELVDYYKKDIEKLEILLNTDLSNWKV